MLRRWILAALLLIGMGLFAQKQGNLKPRIIINTFETSRNVSSDITDILRQKAVEAIINSHRFEIMDKELLKSVQEEELHRSQENAMGDRTARSEQITEAAYDYIVEGKSLDYTVTSSTNKEGKVTYTGKLQYTLTFVDVSSTTAVASSTFTATGSGGTKAEAFNSAITDIGGHVDYMLIEQMPLIGKIIPLDYEVKKKKITHCYIDLGSAHGANEGQYYEIQACQMRAGRLVYKPIARLKIEEVVDETMSYCKISKDGKDFYEAMERFLNLDEKEQKKYSFRVVMSHRLTLPWPF